MAKILVVDDDRTLLDVLKYNLEKEFYSVITSTDGVTALSLARKERPDLIILDVMLPGLDGFELCRILRRETEIPILILSARTEEVDKIVGLDLGADDYLTKPFSMRELLSRIRAVLRRARLASHQKSAAKEEALPIIRIGDIELDTASRRVARRGQEVKLTPKEFDLLSYLMVHRDQAVKRDRLIEAVWGYDFEGSSRTIDVHIYSLRQKIEDDPNKPVHILTVHGYGYKFQ